MGQGPVHVPLTLMLPGSTVQPVCGAVRADYRRENRTTRPRTTEATDHGTTEPEGKTGLDANAGEKNLAKEWWQGNENRKGFRFQVSGFILGLHSLARIPLPPPVCA